MNHITQAERISALETRVAFLIDDCREMNKKLDDLLALRNKGAGVFWLASMLFGTSLAGLFLGILAWLRA